MGKNVYDEKKFFEAYSNIRNNEYNYNDLIEKAAMKKLISSLKDKVVLDLVCRKWW